MKKVLIISSSPRRGGNSDTLAEQFRKGAEDAGNAVEKIFLAEKTIHFCLGCGACNNTGRCVQKDDMAELLSKIQAADVVVLASPVYFYTPNAAMKNFIDRTVPLYSRMRDKDFYFILAAAEDSPETLDRSIECLRGWLDCFEGSRERGIVRGTGAWKVGDIKGSPALKIAYDYGKSV